MDEVVIWGRMESGSRLRIGCSNAKHAPIPFAAEIIARTEECDARMMLRWCRRRAKRGWSIAKIRDACER